MEVIPHHQDRSTYTNDPERLLAEQEAADFIGVTRRALQQWRLTGTGPVYVKISARCVRYRRADLIKWAEERLTTSTSEVTECA